MDLDRHDEHKQHTFDSFCKKVIRCEGYSAYRAIGRRQDLEIPFSQLPEEAMEALAAWDVYPWEYTSFPVDGDVILIKDDRLADALAAVKATGYGVVMPGAEEMKLEKPEILKKNGTYGVRLKAGAPSIHMMRVDIDTEIAPMVGDEQQSRELISFLQGEDPEKLWGGNIFGKSVYDLIQEGLNAKLVRLPEDVRGKFRGTLTRIVNEGATGLVCLIL